jgi:hypothetical protein
MRRMASATVRASRGCVECVLGSARSRVLLTPSARISSIWSTTTPRVPPRDEQHTLDAAFQRSAHLPIRSTEASVTR